MISDNLPPWTRNVWVVLADGVAKADVPPFAVIVCAQIRVCAVSSCAEMHCARHECAGTQRAGTVSNADATAIS